MGLSKQSKTNAVIKKNMQQKLESLTEGNEQLKKDKDGIVEKYESIKKDIKTLENQYKIEQKKRNEMEIKMKKSESELDALNDKFRVKMVMLNDQNETICQLKEDKDELKHTIDSYIDKEKELKEKHNDL